MVHSESHAVFRSSAGGKKIKHLSKYWWVVYTGRPLQVKYWGVATPATPAALTLMNVTLLAFAAAAPLLLSAGRAAIDRYLLPAIRTAANPQR